MEVFYCLDKFIHIVLIKRLHKIRQNNINLIKLHIRCQILNEKKVNLENKFLKYENPSYCGSMDHIIIISMKEKLKYI